jgi:tRNA(Ile)-lysidine synthase
VRAAADTPILIDTRDGLVGDAARSFEGVARTSGAPFLLAVSGGSDSLAMLHLFARWADGTVPASVVTVDHRLRSEAAKEARFVADQCQALGLPHTTLIWERDGENGKATQADARIARYRLLAAHAKMLGARSVLLGHTQNDQLETLSMRLRRLATAQYAALGTSGIAAEIEFGGVCFHRPLLELQRDVLRRYLVKQGADDWVEDPSNNDTKYERVRVRRQGAHDHAAQLLSFQQVAARWRALVEQDAVAFVREHTKPGLEHVRFERRAFARLPEAVQRFVLGVR